LSVIMSQMKQVSLSLNLKTVNEELSSTVTGSEFQTAGAE